MAGGSSVALMRDIQTLFDIGTASGLTDRQLLDRFVNRHDAEAAFEMLVLRHGPMVLRVCHNLLRDPNDAHDAFQATFLFWYGGAGQSKARFRRRMALRSRLPSGRTARVDSARRHIVEARGISRR